MTKKRGKTGMALPPESSDSRIWNVGVGFALYQCAALTIFRSAKAARLITLSSRTATPPALITSHCAPYSPLFTPDPGGRVLGEGFYGRVHLATHRRTGRKLVLKALKRDHAGREAFMKEISLLRDLSHPMVLQYVGVFCKARQLHLVTEYLGGGTLSDLIASDKELSWDTRCASTPHAPHTTLGVDARVLQLPRREPGTLVLSRLDVASHTMPPSCATLCRLPGRVTQTIHGVGPR